MMTQQLRNALATNKLFSFVRAWVNAFCDPLHLIRGVLGVRGYFKDFKKYRSFAKAEKIKVLDLRPKLHDRTPKTLFDPHYFWMSGWAIRRILADQPAFHVDVGSHNLFVNLLGAVVPTVFVDYRPLLVRLSGLNPFAGDILNLPFKDSCLRSLSCLHVAEHIGLGRYGDPLNPRGTELACRELIRVLAPGGNLFFALPVGKKRICFNAHRIHPPERIENLLSPLRLLEFSTVYDDGEYRQHVPISDISTSVYGLGLFWFKKVVCYEC